MGKKHLWNPEYNIVKYLILGNFKYSNTVNIQ